ncbi:MAG: hypothetical protein AB7J28_15135 [Hyphomonadaceae bacterium]
MTQADALAAYLGPDVFDRLRWENLSDAQRDAILSVFRLGLNAGASSGSVSVIDSVLAKGRVVLCEDGSRWSAREKLDADLLKDWGEGALVAIHRGMLYRLDEYEAVEVDALRL